MDESEEPENWNDEARIACQLAFRCPQTWDRLTLTENAGIRHCSECDRDVHLALAQADFRRYGEEGHCVAVRVLTTTGRLGYAVGNEEVRRPGRGY
jgi:hypothetical protein